MRALLALVLPLWAQGYYLLKDAHVFIGSLAHEFPLCAVRDSAGYLYIGGYSQASARSLPDGWIACVAPTGETRWMLAPGGMGPDRIEDLVESDSVLYFCGTSGSVLTHPEELPVERRADFWVGAVEKSTGRFLWQTRWGSPYTDMALTLCLTPYRTLLVGGLTWEEPGIGMQAVIHVVRATNGEVLQRLLWGQAPSLLRRIRPIPGTRYYACIGEQAYRPFVGAVDFVGQIYWRTVFQFHRFPSQLFALHVSPAGQIYVGGRYGQRWGVSMLDQRGRVVWEYLWPEEGLSGSIFCLTEGPEGILYAAGGQFSPSLVSSEQKGGTDAWLAALTPQGKLLWERSFGGPYDEEGRALVSSPQGIWVIAAKENRFSEGVPHADAWVVPLRAIPCGEIPVEVRTDVPSLREKAGRPIRFWVQLPSAYRESRIEWDFGDGATATGREVTHIYGEPGSYAVQVSLKMAYGCSEVGLPPVLLRITRP